MRNIIKLFRHSNPLSRHPVLDTGSRVTRVLFEYCMHQARHCLTRSRIKCGMTPFVGMTGVVGFLLFSTAINAATLKEELVHIYQNHDQLKAERERILGKQQEYRQVFADFLPTISASASKQWSEQTFGDTESSIDPEIYGANINQPIFAGGRTSNNLKSTKYAILAEQETLRALEQNLLMSGIEAYLSIDLAREIVKINHNNVSNLQRHLEASKIRHEVGELTITNVSQARARLANAQAQLTEAEASLVNAKAAYRRIFGKPYDIAKHTPNIEQIFMTELELIDLATANNPDIVAAKHRMKSQEYRVKMAKSAFYPTIDLNGSYQRERDTAPSRGGDFENATLSIDLNVPLFTGGKATSTLKQFKHDYNNTTYLLDDTKRNVEQEVRSAFANYNAAKLSLNARKQSIASARQALNSLEEEYKAGLRTTLDVLDAEQELLNASIDYKRTENSLISRYFVVQKSLGKLDAKNLELPCDIISFDEAFTKKFLP